MVRLKLTKGSVSSSVIWKIFLFGYFPRAILLVANFEGNPLHHSVEYYTTLHHSVEHYTPLH